MSNQLKNWAVILGILAAIFLAFFITYQVMKIFTKKEISEKDYQIKRLQKEIKFNNLSYLKIVFENDSLIKVNEKIRSQINESEEQTQYYLSKYIIFRNKLQQGDTTSQGDINATLLDSTFLMADKVIENQRSDINRLTAININNETIIKSLTKQLKDTRDLMNGCDDLLEIARLRNEKLGKKYEKAKNKRNIWIGIGIAEAALIVVMLWLGSS